MDLVAAAQLIFPVVCTDASLLSNCSAHVTEMLLCCSAFSSLDQKSPVVSSHFHSSISSMSSAKMSHKHSSKVQSYQQDPFHHIFMSHASLGMQQQFLCQYCHGQCAFLTCVCFREDKQSTCCWLWQVPSVLVGLDAQSFHVVQFTRTTQWAPLRSGRLSYLCLWTIPLLALVWKDGIWSGHVLQWSFAWPLPWLLSYCRFPCPNIPDFCTRHQNSWPEDFLRRLLMAVVALVLYAFGHYLLPTNTFLNIDLHSTSAANSCTTFSSFCMPSGVSAKIHI